MTKSIIALVCVTTSLAACTSADHPTMKMLRAGDAKICVAGDVEQELRKLVLPRQKSPEGYTVSFSDTTLETFDQIVSKASCHASIKVDTPSGVLVQPTPFDYTIVPSAQDPTSFVVSASLEAFAERVASAIESDENARQERDAESAAEAKLAATVKPAWLAGRWVNSQLGSNACSTGPYIQFAGGRRFLDANGPSGTWRLDGLQASITGTDASHSITFAEAEQNAFTVDLSDGNQESYRRCSKQEMTPPVSEDTSEIDAENP